MEYTHNNSSSDHKEFYYSRLVSELKKRDMLLYGVAWASNCLLTIPDIDVAINQALAVLGETAGVDRVYLFENHPHPLTGEAACSQRYEWVNHGITPQIGNEDLQNSAYMASGMTLVYETLTKGEIFEYLVRELPETERVLLEPQGIVSILIVPIFSDGKLWGFIGFDDCQTERIWTNSEKSVISTIAASIGGALERKCVVKALAEEKERLAVILGSIEEGVITVDTEGRIAFMNNAGEALTGWSLEDALSRTLGEVFTIIDEKTRRQYKDPLKKVLKARRPGESTSHTVLISKDGREIIVSDRGTLIYDRDNKAIGTLVVFRDITEKVRMEQENIKAHKIESIGILAGGIAHDFNNILTVVLGNISLAIMHAEDDDREKVLKRLRDVEKASMQARDLTQQLLTFAKGGMPVLKSTCVKDLLEDTVSFVLRGSNVKCEFTIPRDLWSACADSGQISQVINNIVINGKQAMAEGGTMEIIAENVVISENSHIPLEYGLYIKLIIKDTGIGISDDNLSRIFEPYFTTKPSGSGLGLATSYSIIKRHGGYITAESTPGIGTTFYVYLPASQDKEKCEVQEKMPLRQKGTILVMDDDEAVRDVVGLMLNQLGYDVHFAADGCEAIRKYMKFINSKTPFDATIMDLTIPGGMGGKETIRRLLEMDPNVRAIVSSGYSNDPVMANYLDYGFRGIVEKPYKIEELGKVLQRILSKED